MAAPQEVLDILLPLVMSSEGCKLEAYKDPVGVITIGWGHTAPGLQMGTTWPQSYADLVLGHDLGISYAELIGLIPAMMNETLGRQAAITDFVYNLGIGRLTGSTLRKRIEVGDWEGAKVQLAAWVRGGGKTLPGLVTRRAKEIALC